LGYPEILRHARHAHVLKILWVLTLYIAKLTQALTPRNRARGSPFLFCNIPGYRLARFAHSGYHVGLLFLQPSDMMLLEETIKG
jgi:hypothetical protein